ncbi:MAG: DUF937 domain-containing protein [Betaproteobacteria bacterium]|nr:DUF937 domain-containing protein [Betaproteobacteria bacterium]
MGLLDQVLGAALSKGGQSQGGIGDLGGLGGLGDLLGGRSNAATGGGNLLVTLLPLVLMMLQNRGGASGAGGGLGGLLQQLQGAGLGQQADSWIGSGDNAPISPEQLRSALGPDSIHELAAQAGVSDDEVSGGLASLLPELVNQLTPEGRLPADGGQVDTAFADLRRSLGM